MDLPRVPPWGLRIPPVGPKRRTLAVLKSIKILIIFWPRFLIDFGPFWGANLGSFLALLAAKIGQDRSKTRLGSVSTSKTLILLPYYVFQYRISLGDPKMASKMPQDRPKTAPRGSWRALFSLLKIVLIFDSSWVRFWSILGRHWELKTLGWWVLLGS